MKTLFALTALITCTACSSMNGAREATTLSERNPIAVDQQSIVYALPVEAGRIGLTTAERAQMSQLVTKYRQRGHGAITVTAPSGLPGDAGGRLASMVSGTLNEFGVQMPEILRATYPASGASDTVLISFAHYVATGPVCGDFSGELQARFRNQSSPEFGCSHQANLAAMIADPRDLSEPADASLGNGAMGAAAVRSLNNGSSDWAVEGARAATPGAN